MFKNKKSVKENKNTKLKRRFLIFNPSKLCRKKHGANNNNNSNNIGNESNNNNEVKNESVNNSTQSIVSNEHCIKVSDFLKKINENKDKINMEKILLKSKIADKIDFYHLNMNKCIELINVAGVQRTLKSDDLKRNIECITLFDESEMKRVNTRTETTAPIIATISMNTINKIPTDRRESSCCNETVSYRSNSFFSTKKITHDPKFTESESELLSLISKFEDLNSNLNNKTNDHHQHQNNLKIQNNNNSCLNAIGKLAELFPSFSKK